MSDSLHPILGAAPSQVTPSHIPMMNQQVAAIASKTDPMPYVEIAPEEKTKYYTCRVPNHHMIRTDGKKLAFTQGVLATRDANDIVYMEQVLRERNPFVREATEEEIKHYEMTLDPVKTLKNQITPEVEAAVQKDLSAKLSTLVQGMSLSEEDKAKLLGAVSLPAGVSDIEKIQGVDFFESKEKERLQMSGATATAVKMSADDIRASLVGSNRTANAAASTAGKN